MDVDTDSLYQGEANIGDEGIRLATRADQRGRTQMFWHGGKQSYLFIWVVMTYKYVM